MKKNVLIMALALLASQASFAMDNNNNNNNNKRYAIENDGNSNTKKYQCDPEDDEFNNHNALNNANNNIALLATLAMQTQPHTNNLHTNAPYHELPTGLRMTLPFQNNNNNNLPSNHEDDESDDDHSNSEHIDKKVRLSREYKCDHPDCVNRNPYKALSGLNAHLLTHKENPEEERRFPCRIDGCNKRFKQKEHRNAHEQSFTHANQKRYRCSDQDCNASFARKSDLTNHINTVHLNIANPSLTCTACAKVFTRPSNLRTHMLVHTGEKRYQCQCGYACARSDAFAIHKKSCSQWGTSAATILIAFNSSQNPQATGNLQQTE